MGFLYFIIVQHICILTPNGPLFRPSDDKILFLLLFLRESDPKQWSPSSQQLEERGPMGGLQAWVHNRGRSKSVQTSWWTQPRIPCFEIFVLLKLGLFSWWHYFLLPHYLAHLKNAQGTATSREADSIACSRRSEWSGVRRERRKREKDKEEKRERERGGNDCEINLVPRSPTAKCKTEWDLGSRLLWDLFSKGHSAHFVG